MHLSVKGKTNSDVAETLRRGPTSRSLTPTLPGGRGCRRPGEGQRAASAYSPSPPGEVGRAGVRVSAPSPFPSPPEKVAPRGNAPHFNGPGTPPAFGSERLAIPKLPSSREIQEHPSRLPIRAENRHNRFGATPFSIFTGQSPLAHPIVRGGFAMHLPLCSAKALLRPLLGLLILSSPGCQTASRAVNQKTLTQPLPYTDPQERPRNGPGEGWILLRRFAM